MPKVSIIIPCYNYGDFIKDAIRSVENQTFTDLEIIVVDDGSDEKTINILKQFKKKNIKIFYLDKNYGPSYARNFGILNSTGKYILPLDADDTINEKYTELAVEILENNPSIGIVYCKAKMFGTINETWDLPEYSLDQMIFNNIIFVTSFFRKEDWEKVNGFDINFKDEWEDYDFWLKILELGRDVYKIPEFLFNYRKGHPSRAWRSHQDILPLYEKIYNKHKEFYSQNILLLFKEILKVKKENEEMSKELNLIKSSRAYKIYSYMNKKIKK